MVEDLVLDIIDSFKFLGIHLVISLTRNAHIDSAKMASCIFALRTIHKLCSAQVQRMAYFGLIYSIPALGLYYGKAFHPEIVLGVFRLQKRAGRILFKIKTRKSC